MIHSSITAHVERQYGVTLLTMDKENLYGSEFEDLDPSTFLATQHHPV